MRPAQHSLTTATTAPAANAARSRARLAVCTLYLLTGITLGSWSARAPVIREHLAVSDGLWGAGLSAASLAEVVALLVVVVIVHAVAPHRLAITGAAVVLLAIPVLGWVTTMAQLVCVLACWFFAAQLMAAPMGGMAIEVGRRYGRPLMASFVAVWTIGTAVGAGLSTLAATLEITVRVQFTATSVLLGVLIGAGARWLPTTPTPPGSSPSSAAPPSSSPPATRRLDGWLAGRFARWGAKRRGQLLRRWTPGMWLIAGISLAGAYTASAIGQWSALYVADTAGEHAGLSAPTGAALASGTVTAMYVAGGVVLLVSDRVRSRLGPVGFVRCSVGCAVAGLVGALAYPVVGVVVAGLVLLGLGSACVGPTVDGLAGE